MICATNLLKMKIQINIKMTRSENFMNKRKINIFWPNSTIFPLTAVAQEPQFNYDMGLRYIFICGMIWLSTRKTFTVSEGISLESNTIRLAASNVICVNVNTVNYISDDVVRSNELNVYQRI